MSDPFENLISLGDAAQLWHKNEGNLRHAIARGKFKEGIDCKKFGKQWIFFKSALEREYGSIE